MTPLEEQQAAMITRGKVEPEDMKKWGTRFLVGGAVYFILGGREVKTVVAVGTVYYLVQKKMIQKKTEEATENVKNKVAETFEEMRKRLFGK